MAGIAAPDDLVDEATPGREVVEIARAPQQQGVLDRPLEMAVGAFDRAVLMGDAGIVAGGRHAVMGVQVLVTAGEVGLGVALQIAEGRRETVAAMLLGNAAERLQGVLQAFGQRHETLAAEDHMGVFEARIGQPEVIKPMRQRQTGDRHGLFGHVGDTVRSGP